MSISPKTCSFSERIRARLCWIIALTMAFFNPIATQAQPLIGESLNVSPIAGGSGSLHPSAQELVITNETDYHNFYALLGITPPTSPTVNFATEDVLAVTTGAQPQGSSVNISGVDIRTTGFTAGWAFPHIQSTIATAPPPVTISGTASNAGGAFSQTGGTFIYTGGTVLINPTLSTGSGGVWSASGSTANITGGITIAGSQTFPNWNLSNIGGTISGAGAFSVGGGTASWIGGTVTTTSLGIQIVNGVVTITGGTGAATSSTSSPFTVAGGTTTVTPPVTYPYTVVKVNKGALAYAFVFDVTWP